MSEFLSSNQLTNIYELASLGIRPLIIAEFIGITLPDLLETAGTEIANAAMEAHKAVLKSLHAMAISRKSVAATIFWLKNMCADLLATAPKKPPKSPRNDEPISPDNYKPIEFDVYCNDGEPNFDD